MASQAHPGASAFIRNGLDPANLAVFDVHMKIAGASAMAVAYGMDNLVHFFIVSLGHKVFLSRIRRGERAFLKRPLYFFYI
jgi:hypothetical protein